MGSGFKTVIGVVDIWSVGVTEGTGAETGAGSGNGNGSDSDSDPDEGNFSDRGTGEGEYTGEGRGGSATAPSSCGILIGSNIFFVILFCLSCLLSSRNLSNHAGHPPSKLYAG